MNWQGLLVMAVVGLVVAGLIIWSNRRNKTAPTSPRAPVVDDGSGDKPYNNGNRK